MVEQSVFGGGYSVKLDQVGLRGKVCKVNNTTTNYSSLDSRVTCQCRNKTSF